MILYAILAGAALAAFLGLLKWSLKTLLPRRAGAAVDRLYATVSAIIEKIMALAFLLFIGFVVYIAFYSK